MIGITPVSISSSDNESAGKPAVSAIIASVLASLFITIISSEKSCAGVDNGCGFLIEEMETGAATAEEEEEEVMA
jgi:hypothetical protein